MKSKVSFYHLDGILPEESVLVSQGSCQKLMQLECLKTIGMFHSLEAVLCAVPSLSSMGLLCAWDSPGKKTGVGSHSLLQMTFPTQGSNLCLLHLKADSLLPSHQESSNEYG